jgi:spore coat polysaccharide biosynthesis protein SpsF
VNRKRITAIIQARIGSTRLPGKVLMPIHGKPMLQHIVERLRSVEAINKVVVATSESGKDDRLAEFCDDCSIPFYRGSEEDVLDRFYHAAKNFGGEHMIRITGDCPLIDPLVVSRLIDYYFQDGFDFCGVAAGAGVAGREVVGRYPDGLDAEIFSMEILTIAWREAKSELHREHVTPFIWQQPERFRLEALYPENGDYSHCRWTVDNREDLALVHWIYEELYSTNTGFGMKEILELLNNHPEKADSNTRFIGKEGYEKFST